MRKREIIREVNSILQDSRGIFIVTTKGFCDINNNLIQEGDYFNTSNNYIYGYNGETTFVKVRDIFKNITTGYTSGCKIFSKNNIICYKLQLKENKVKYQLINDKDITNFCITGRNIPICKEDDKIVFTDKKHSIFLYDIQNNKNLWSYILPEGFSIFKQPQIVGDVLFFDSFKNVNEENFVVGLDLKTGEVLWQLLFRIPYKEQLLATTLHKENKLCYGYLGNLYQIFNPILGKIVFEKEMNEKINPYTNAIYDNKLWFVSGKYEECKFGYINLANNELELLQDFPQEDDETFEIVYHQKKLYLRGKYYNNLYIFEE